MQPNGTVIVDTICRTAKLGTTITGATENGDVTVIEAEPVEPINECPTCGQPGVFRDHVIRSLVDLPIVGHPTTSCAPSTLPVHQQALLADDLPCWPCLRARKFKHPGPGDPLDPATTLPKSDERAQHGEKAGVGILNRGGVLAFLVDIGEPVEIDSEEMREDLIAQFRIERPNEEFENYGCTFVR